MHVTVQCYSPIISPEHINGIPVCHNSVLTAPKSTAKKIIIKLRVNWKGSECADVAGEVGWSCTYSSVNMLPCTDKLITRGESSPAVDGLKRAKVERQIFHAVGATVVEINTGGHLGWFAGHRCELIGPGRLLRATRPPRGRPRSAPWWTPVLPHRGSASLRVLLALEGPLVFRLTVSC